MCAKFAILFGALGGPGACRADVLLAVQLLREGGCGGLLPAAQPLHRSALLDHAARDWAREGPGTPGAAAGLSPGAAAGCRTIAAPYTAPSRTEAPLLIARVLDLVNAVRASGTQCGGRAFGPVPPVRLSVTLGGVALSHASDMARHDYFEHQDLTGHTPADRVRAVGYREKLVGENIAYGPQSADEVMRGWLDSPGHCENIMDARFAEMGVAFAAGQASKHGLYWVQLLAAPAV